MNRREAAARILRAISDLGVWKRAEERAPHKPLLLLWALGQFQASPGRTLPFAEIEIAVGALLDTYGPPRSRKHPEYPFWRLQANDIWQVEADGPMVARRSNTDPKISELRRCNARGRFASWVERELSVNPGLWERAVLSLLRSHFPTELHERILRDCSIDLVREHGGVSQVGAGNRRAILEAFDHTCAVSGYRASFDGVPFGVEVAYLRWPQAGGLCNLENAVCLSKLHVDLLALGLITFTDDGRVHVAGGAVLSREAARILHMSHERRIRGPRGNPMMVAPANIVWHNNQVFRGDLSSLRVVKNK